MADDIPHKGAPSGMEMDPEFEPLPLSIRPFDPTTYHPKIHVLPPDSIHQFRRFAQGAPEDLLLPESESHLSHVASKGRLTRFPLSLYQIAIEPVPDGHELVRVRGPTPALEVAASLMGDGSNKHEPTQHLRYSAVLGAPAGAAARPSVPPQAAERERRGDPAHSRGRARHTNDESGPSKPVPDNEETDEDEEPTSPQSESSEGEGDGTGSGSEGDGDTEEGSEEGSGGNSGSSSDSDLDSGADGDSVVGSTPPRKRTKRASRA
ncbi:uncharacterized protein LOC114273783 [Camellia sinensis]|uniref:uncharacterized protein LOC114273783 n=1 Tax=Camellia sinensis TaxID=4442 RepID=UPI001035B4BB|nr:uncharacterized protein LOC114273783 [Camellia sinensis]